MNYRHIYHAGNFADVVKHIILLRVIAYMQRKEAGFLMLDTHAGIGRYDLASAQAQKTREADRGIRQFLARETPLSHEVEALLAGYRDLLNGLNAGRDVMLVPGSPEILTRYRRPQDRCVFNELHPEDYKALGENYRREKRVEVTQLDAWQSLRAKLPPPERRGLILVDPPFEKPTETSDLVKGVAQALTRFSTGTYLIWYPLKDSKMGKQLRDSIRDAPVATALDTQLYVNAPQDGQFTGSGMIILNPPFTLFDELQRLLPALTQALAERPDRGNWATQWLIAPQ